MPEIKTGAAYVRVSTDGQMDLSPESQLDEILAYAHRHNIIVPKEYIFMEQQGVSGKKADKRAAFQCMIATAKMTPKPFDCIIVWKFSRFARNQDESTFYKGILRKRHNIDVVSVSEPIMEGMYGRLVETIIEWSDEFYSYNLAGEVRRGMKKRVEKGLPASQPPYGYNVVPGKTPEVNPEEAAIVKMIFDRYVTGQDAGTITRYLNDHQIKTKRNGKWRSESVIYVLENPYYIGQIRWNRRSSSGSSKLKDRSEWLYSEGKHDPIINKDVFDRVQERRRISQETHSRYQHSVSHTKHWLSSIVKCSICGRSLSFKFGSHSVRCNTFQCTGYNSGLHRESQAISERKLTTAVLQSLRAVLDQEDVSYKLIDQRLPEDDIARRMAAQELSRIATKEERIKEAYMNGIDTMDEYRANREMLARRREELQEILAADEENDAAADPALLKSKVKSVLEILEDDDVPFDRKAQALRSVVQRIDFNKAEQKLTFHYFLYKA